MLERIWVQSFLLIDKLEMCWHQGLHVITGETGAGKSLLLDAIGCLSGQKTDAKWVRQGAESAEVGAVFSPPFSSDLMQWMGEQGFSVDEELWLRRVVDTQGKSKVWINQKPMPLAALKYCAGELIELAHQHMHIQWLKPEAQRVWFDASPPISECLERVKQHWRVWQDALKALDVARTGVRQKELEREILSRRYKDLEPLNPTPDAWDEMNRLHARISGAADRIERVISARVMLYEDKDAILDRVYALMHQLSPIIDQDDMVKNASELLGQAHILLDEARHVLRQVDLEEGDAVSLDELESRIASWLRVARRYNVTGDRLFELWQQTQKEWQLLEDAAQIDVLEASVCEAEAGYQKAAHDLTVARKAQIKAVEQAVQPWLKRLNLPDARFSIYLKVLDKPGAHGCEDVLMVFSSHGSLDMVPLAEGASGGELARIALVLSLLNTQHGVMPVRFFDEVDTGISGSTVAEVGRLLQQHALNNQIICITHQPQMAACADIHWKVEKIVSGMPRTQINALSEVARHKEIARLMAAGAGDEQSAELHAQQLRQSLARI